MKTMKHYLMAFLILFSALSNSGVGATVFQWPDKSEPVLLNDTQVVHSGCNTSALDILVVSTAEAHQDCLYCVAGCQCDQSLCHQLAPSLIGAQSSCLDTRDIVKNFMNLTSSRLEEAFMLPEFRPPKAL